MRKLIQFMVIAFVSVSSLGNVMAQDGASLEETSRKVLEFKSSVPIIQCSLAEMKPVEGMEEVSAPVGAKIITIKSANNKTAFYFLTWDGGAENEKNKIYRGDLGIEGKEDVFYWCVDDTYLLHHAEERKQRGEWDIAVGALTVPVKLRPGWSSLDFEFTAEAVLGGAFDVKWRLSDRRDIFFDVLFFAGLAPEVELTEKNSAVESPEKATAFSYGCGIGISGPNFGISMVGGMDAINNNNIKKWDYQNRPWLGFSIGTSIGITATDGSPKMQSE